MSRFTPTLRLDITKEDAAAVEEQEGLSVKEIGENLANVFKRLGVVEKPVFTASKITDIGTGESLTQFEALVVGKFFVEDLIHLKLATGDVVAMEFNVI